MRRCSGIPRSLTLSLAPVMSLLQCPRQCPPTDADIWVLFPASVRTYGDGTAGNLKMTKSDIL
ncbi:unnamed protein product [Staurois parvus]|uniref:Secreted protein n=1 Tax=Staurois parvus TaxID=386267 RepID=A0ABN9E722_9NEOB|nr:unnamed protein product [Staurois parvus]